MVHGKGKIGSWAGYPAFPLFLQPLELRSLFSFPDRQEKSSGGNCPSLITALSDGCCKVLWQAKG